MDEILDYLLWKYRHEIGHGVCLLSGFALGSAPALVGGGQNLFATCGLVAAIVAMILMFRNNRQRDYHVTNTEEDDR